MTYLSPPQASRLLRRLPLFLGAFFATVLSALAQGDPEDLRINEVDSDTPGTDTMEFVELFDGGAGSTPLDGFVLVFFNGNAANDASYAAFDLDGFTTNPQGFFVVGNPLVPNVGRTFPVNTLQNGADAVALYLADATDFPNGTPVTTFNLQDVLVYDNDNSDDIGLLTGLQPTGATLIQVNENGGGKKVDESMARVPDGGSAFDARTYRTQAPTPGVSNVIALEIHLMASPAVISESGGTTVSQVTVTLDASSASPLVVTLTGTDPGELSVPASITIPAGMTTGSFMATAVNDAWPDGDQTVQITATAVGYLDGLTSITVQDDGDADPGIALNEIYASVDSGGGDANQDGVIGTGDGSDEFVEIVNTSASNLDLSGFTLSDAATVRHTFPVGTVLSPGCALIVFGGGNVLEGRLAAFGGALIQKANGSNSFGLSLNNAGDLVSIRNAPGSGGLEVAGYAFGLSGTTFGNTTSSLGSFARDPDLTGNFALGPYSAGVRRDFSPFCPLPPQLVANFAANPVAENAGTTTLQISVSPAPASDLTVLVSSSDPGVATVPATATITAGTTSRNVTVTLLNNAYQNAAITVTFVASATGYLTGATQLTVTDDGDPPIVVTINEVDYDPAGTDAAGTEFVELFAEGVANFPLDGFVLVFYNGNATTPVPDAEYRIIDLTGARTNAGGYYVATTPADGIQNGGAGGDAIALYRGAPAGSFAMTGPGGPPVGAQLLDALVYEADDTSLTIPLGYTGANLNDNGSADGISRLPDGTGPFQLAPLTRGATNGGSAGNGYTTWAAGFPGIGGPTVDDEFDGLKNLLEYLLGKNPTLPDPAPGLVPIRNGNGRPQVSIAKGAAAGADPLLVARVEVTTSLTTGTWSTVNTNVLIDNATSLVVEYTGPSPIVFMRVVATYP